MPLDPSLPISLSSIGGRYLLFDIETAMYLRRVHRMCGATVGSLPQAPQQNIFLGLPIELMAEEAQFLLEEGVAYLVDDAKAHDRRLALRDRTKKAKYLEQVRAQGQKASDTVREQKAVHSRNVRNKRGSSKDKDSKDLPPNREETPDSFGFDDPPTPASTSTLDTEVTPTDSVAPSTTTIEPYAITPTTSTALLSPPSPPSPPRLGLRVPNLRPSYALYRHLHTHPTGYFLTPGLRFGCQYTVYPGDPLRFHSHFLAVGVSWDEEIDLMDIVGGGRLGTGVKKGFLVGGAEQGHLEVVDGDDEGEKGDQNNARVRTFSIEWAAM